MCFRSFNDWKTSSVKRNLTHLMERNTYCMDFLARPRARIKSIYENPFPFPLVKLGDT